MRTYKKISLLLALIMIINLIEPIGKVLNVRSSAKAAHVHTAECYDGHNHTASRCAKGKRISISFTRHEFINYTKDSECTRFVIELSVIEDNIKYTTEYSGSIARVQVPGDLYVIWNDPAGMDHGGTFTTGGEALKKLDAIPVGLSDYNGNVEIVDFLNYILNTSAKYYSDGTEVPFGGDIYDSIQDIGYEVDSNGILYIPLNKMTNLCKDSKDNINNYYTCRDENSYSCGYCDEVVRDLDKFIVTMILKLEDGDYRQSVSIYDKECEKYILESDSTKVRKSDSTGYLRSEDAYIKLNGKKYAYSYYEGGTVDGTSQTDTSGDSNVQTYINNLYVKFRESSVGTNSQTTNYSSTHTVCVKTITGAEFKSIMSTICTTYYNAALSSKGELLCNGCINNNTVLAGNTCNVGNSELVCDKTITNFELNNPVIQPLGTVDLSAVATYKDGHTANITCTCINFNNKKYYTGETLTFDSQSKYADYGNGRVTESYKKDISIWTDKSKVIDAYELKYPNQVISYGGTIDKTINLTMKDGTKKSVQGICVFNTRNTNNIGKTVSQTALLNSGIGSVNSELVNFGQSAANIPITITLTGLKSITSNNPKQIIYKGEDINKDCKVLLLDNTTIWNKTGNDIVVTGYDPDKYGEQTVTLSYTLGETVSTTIQVFVVPEIASIKADDLKIHDKNYNFMPLILLEDGTELELTKTLIRVNDIWNLSDYPEKFISLDWKYAYSNSESALGETGLLQFENNKLINGTGGTYNVVLSVWNTSSKTINTELTSISKNFQIKVFDKCSKNNKHLEYAKDSCPVCDYIDGKKSELNTIKSNIDIEVNKYKDFINHMKLLKTTGMDERKDKVIERLKPIMQKINDEYTIEFSNEVDKNKDYGKEFDDYISNADTSGSEIEYDNNITILNNKYKELQNLNINLSDLIDEYIAESDALILKNDTILNTIPDIKVEVNDKQYDKIKPEINLDIEGLSSDTDYEIPYVIEWFIDDSWTSDAPDYSQVGTYHMRIRTVDIDYQEGIKEITFNITPIKLTVDCSAVDREYDGTRVFEINYGELQGVLTDDDVYISNPQGILEDKNAGQKIGILDDIIKIMGDQSNNYIIDTPNSINVTITKANLKAIAMDKVVNWCGDMPELTINYEGFKDNDTKDSIIIPTISCDCDTEVVGNYDIVLDGGDGGNNYDLELVNGKLYVDSPTGTKEIIWNTPYINELVTVEVKCDLPIGKEEYTHKLNTNEFGDIKLYVPVESLRVYITVTGPDGDTIEKVLDSDGNELAIIDLSKGNIIINNDSYVLNGLTIRSSNSYFIKQSTAETNNNITVNGDSKITISGLNVTALSAINNNANIILALDNVNKFTGDIISNNSLHIKGDGILKCNNIIGAQLILDSPVDCDELGMDNGKAYVYCGVHVNTINSYATDSVNQNRQLVLSKITGEFNKSDIVENTKGEDKDIFIETSRVNDGNLLVMHYKDAQRIWLKVNGVLMYYDFNDGTPRKYEEINGKQIIDLDVNLKTAGFSKTDGNYVGITYTRDENQEDWVNLHIQSSDITTLKVYNSAKFIWMKQDGILYKIDINNHTGNGYPYNEDGKCSMLLVTIPFNTTNVKNITTTRDENKTGKYYDIKSKTDTTVTTYINLNAKRIWIKCDDIYFPIDIEWKDNIPQGINEKVPETEYGTILKPIEITIPDDLEVENILLSIDGKIDGIYVEVINNTKSFIGYIYKDITSTYAYINKELYTVTFINGIWVIKKYVEGNVYDTPTNSIIVPVMEGEDAVSEKVLDSKEDLKVIQKQLDTYVENSVEAVNYDLDAGTVYINTEEMVAKDGYLLSNKFVTNFEKTVPTGECDKYTVYTWKIKNTKTDMVTAMSIRNVIVDYKVPDTKLVASNKNLGVVKPLTDKKGKVLTSKNKYNVYSKKSISVKVKADFGISGADKIQYKIVKRGDTFKDKNWTNLTIKDDTADMQLSNSNWYRLYVKCIDKAGNITVDKTNGFMIDNKKPTVNLKTGKQYCIGQKLRVKDADSGISKITVNGIKVKNNYIFKKRGKYEVIATDKAGNFKVIKIKVVR